MAGRDLTTNVIIGGTTTSGFNSLANRLESMSAVVDQIGSKIREFEKDSLEVYRDYDDNMRNAEYALSSQYKSATGLRQVMDGLKVAAKGWAGETIFHIDDVTQAIDQAAHVGWDYEKILIGIPQAMDIAQAGGLELSEGLGFLVEMMNTTNTSFDDMGMVVDQWATAANRSATDIGEIGEAFMSLSASAMFADSTQELFTMLAVLANVGVTGPKAGTLLRGAMMRMIAPTQKAKNAMAELGATEEELAEWTGPDESAKKLESLGFSAYDASGNLKPMMEIFTSLHDSMVGMDEHARFDILSSIFPLRTINAATAFYNSIESGNMQELFEAIGDSEGYAAKGAEIMMGGLTGSVELLLSKLETFKVEVGETLAPAIEGLASGLGNILDFLNGLDEASMNALVGGMTALGFVGPGLAITAGALKLFGTLGPVPLTIGALAIGISALAAGLHELAEEKFEGNFGTLELDLNNLGDAVDNLETKFSQQEATVYRWQKALTDATQEFSSGSIELAEQLLESTITGKTLSKTQEQEINEYGEMVVRAAQQAIQNAEGLDLNFLEAVLGGPGSTEADRGALEAASGVIAHWYDDIYEDANAIGQELREQLTAALTDHTIDAQEREAIQATQDRLNQIMAEINAGMESAEYYTALERAQRVSEDTIQSFLEETAQKLDEANERTNEAYDRAKGTTRAAFADARAKGYAQVVVNGSRYSTGEETERFVLDTLEGQRQAALQDNADSFGEIAFRGFESLMRDSNFGEAWRYLGQLYDNGFQLYNENGTTNYAGLGVTPEQARSLYGAVEALASSGYLTRFGAMVQPYQNSAAFQPVTQALGNAQGVANALEQYQYNARMGLDLTEADETLTEFEARVGEGEDMPVVAALNTSAVDNWTPPTKYMEIRPQSLFTAAYAEGGRAATPSIFGEDGPEWAIPEEHSERTAALLNAAREASGFGWGDLISRFGGLGGSPGGQQVTINYAPTINTQDAQGVNDALASDKARLLRMIKQALAEDRLRDEVEVFA